jgi:hypothetical protein
MGSSVYIESITKTWLKEQHNFAKKTLSFRVYGTPASDAAKTTAIVLKL